MLTLLENIDLVRKTSNVKLVQIISHVIRVVLIQPKMPPFLVLFANEINSVQSKVHLIWCICQHKSDSIELVWKYYLIYRLPIVFNLLFRYHSCWKRFLCFVIIVFIHLLFVHNILHCLHEVLQVFLISWFIVVSLANQTQSLKEFFIPW